MTGNPQLEHPSIDPGPRNHPRDSIRQEQHSENPYPYQDKINKPRPGTHQGGKEVEA